MKHHPLRTVIYLVIMLTCSGVGGYLIYDHYAAIPPDLATASPDELVAFMLSKYFNRLSPDEQRKFTEAAMKRYASMTDAQRDVVDARIKQMKKDNPEQLRDQAMRVWKQFVVGEAETFVNLPPNKRDAWLDDRIAVWTAMGANGKGPRGESDKKRKEREEREKAPMSVEKQEQVIGFFQKEIFPKTTARERALVMALAKAAVPKLRAMHPNR